MKRFFAAALAIVLPFNYWASSASDADPGNTRVYLPAVANGAAPNESGSLPSSPQVCVGETRLAGNKVAIDMSCRCP